MLGRSSGSGSTLPAAALSEPGAIRTRTPPWSQHRLQSKTEQSGAASQCVGIERHDVVIVAPLPSKNYSIWSFVTLRGLAAPSPGSLDTALPSSRCWDTMHPLFTYTIYCSHIRGQTRLRFPQARPRLPRTGASSSTVDASPSTVDRRVYCRLSPSTVHRRVPVYRTQTHFRLL